MEKDKEFNGLVKKFVWTLVPPTVAFFSGVTCLTLHSIQGSLLKGINNLANSQEVEEYRAKENEKNLKALQAGEISQEEYNSRLEKLLSLSTEEVVNLVHNDNYSKLMKHADNLEIASDVFGITAAAGMISTFVTSKKREETINELLEEKYK